MKIARWLFFAASALLLFMFRNAHKDNLKYGRISLKSEKPFKPFNLLFIADIHRRTLNSDIIPSPVDLIVIGGDLTEKGVPLKRVANNLRVLTAAAPVYFVWGNNDREINEMALRKLFARFGVKVLEDESVELFGNEQLKLVGIDYFNLRENKLEKAFSDVKAEDTVIFVCHTPSIFRHMKNEFRADLMMAGHTHGGQIRLGKIGLYRKGRLTKKDGALQLITNGYGTTTLHLRLGAEAEYHLFTISPEKR